MNLDFLKKSPKAEESGEQDEVVKVINGGIHSALLTKLGGVYTFGCGSDGRLGHPDFQGHVYLYKESHPKYVEALHQVKAVDIQSSYYHVLVLAEII
mmetsp:Transcript_5584/g.9596  ORF Transcript_5584/g.9596 Transcript_5584/m.9596 type:complete len:97 (+) Transcript_5584:1032-1322(+)|eukprot:CAMPEP_0168615260 /NCGR_PEP_ID=MMETSP0449_2-20121227/4412_1 /TAXON_ID=1082188 /ORGANISM="Strombidium rassoulzadegani, Strain ras09" /LENGTH=96 /DNA_ID=CAMNT_0008655993 /DNA_START=986 /DNA_END=1276 /DNA_ORIENTATION=-